MLFYNRGISWETTEKVHKANYFGSLTQASTIRVGSHKGEEVHAPFKSLVPMVMIIFNFLHSPFRTHYIAIVINFS